MNSSKRHRFTLIELLIVISIIAILAGMLLPALNKVRIVSMRIHCMSNIKQLCVCMINYGLDNSDVIVPYIISANTKLSRGVDGPANAPWTFTMRGWFPFTISHPVAYYPESEGKGMFPRKNGIYKCPAMNVIPESLGSIHYGMPGGIIGGFIPSAGWGMTFDSYVPKKWSDIKAPSGKAVLLDSEQVKSGVYAHQGGFTTTPVDCSGQNYSGNYTVDNAGQGMSTRRHLQSTNAAFCDGHVENVPYGRLRSEAQKWNNMYSGLLLGKDGIK